MAPIPDPEAINIRVAEYLTELPPPEVLEQKLEGSGGDCTGITRGTDGREMKETVPKGAWRMKGVNT